MLHRRPTLAKGNTATPPPPLDVEQVDITRIDILVQGYSTPLTYNLEAKDTFTENDLGIEIIVGERRIFIARPFIVFREVSPAKMNKVRPSGSI
jgi:hypothetical protein